MGGSSKKSTVGYQYFLGMHLALCHGPVNRLNKILVGERVAYSAPVVYDWDSGTPADSEKTISINAPGLFGGKKKEGGIQGTVDVCFGAPNQEKNSYLAAHLIFDLPAFRGITCLVLNQCYVAAGSPYPKPWWASVTRFPGQDWYEEKADINSGSANGAHIVRETLLNDDWGLGYPVEIIDDDSFKDVADTLFTEGFGLSYILSGQGTVEEFIQEVIKTVNGVLFTDRITGKFRLKLIRDDYIIGNLLSFGPDNIVEYTSFQRAQPAEMVNEISIIYRRREDYSDSSSTFQDLASVVTQGAIISQTKQFPGIDTDEIAALVGMRELKQTSTPLAQVIFTANRDAWNLDPGEAFIFTWPERGIEQIVMRAVKLDYGDLQDGRIVVTAIEDVFGLPNASYITPQDPIWTDPVGDPTPLDKNDVYEMEVPHYLLAVNLDPGNYSALLEDSSFLIYMAQYPAITGPSYQLWTSFIASQSGFSQRTTGTYTYTVRLSESITENDNNVDILVSDFPPNFSNDFEPDVEIGSLCLIKSNETGVNIEELAIILDFDNSVSGSNTIKLGRGALDTLPKSYSSGGDGTNIWFFENNWAFDPTEYSEGSLIYIRPLPQTGTGTLSLNDGFLSQTTKTFEGRQYLPSPPAYVRIGRDDTPDPVVNTYPISVQTLNSENLYFTWNRTNRLTQTVPGVPPLFFSPLDVTPEDGTEWWLYLYNEDQVDTLTPDAEGEYAVLEKLGSTINTYEWGDEQDIPEGGVGGAPDGYELYAALATDGELVGDGVIYTPAINKTNINYNGTEADFFEGFTDIGDVDMTTSGFTLIVSVKPDNSVDTMTYISKSSELIDISNTPLLWVGQSVNDLYVQSGHGADSSFVHFISAVSASVYQTFIINVQMNTSPFSGGFYHHTVTVYKDGILLTPVGPSEFPSPFQDLTGTTWSLGCRFNATPTPTADSRVQFYKGFMKDVYMYDGIITPDDFGILRKNNKVRFRLKAVRDDGIDIFSQETFDWTFDRRGWTYNFNEYWNGSEA
jgi:hypothetical protein